MQNKKFIANSAIYTISNIINAAIPFLLLPILTNYLSPEDYGKVTIFQTITGAYSTIIGINVASSATRNYYEYKNSKNELSRYIGSCIQILLLTSALTLIISILSKNFLTRQLNTDFNHILWSIFISTIYVITLIRLGQWQAKSKAISYGTLQISQSVFNAATTYFFVVSLNQSATGRISSLILTAGIFGIISATLLIRDGFFNIFSWTPKHIKDAIKFGIPLAPHIIGNFLLTSMDKIVIGSKLGLSDVGIYTIAAQIATSLTIIFDSFNKTYIPWIYEKLQDNNEKDNILVAKKIIYIGFLITISGLSLYILTPSLIALIANNNYLASTEIIGWMILGQIFNGIYLIISNIIIYTKKTGYLSASTITSGLLNYVLLLLFLENFGIEVGAIAFCASTLLRLIFVIQYSQKLHPLPWKSSFLSMLKFKNHE